MKVAIAGGWSDTDTQANEAWELRIEDRRSFELACESIGRRLAAKRHTLIVGNDQEHSADLHVVHGFLSAFGEHDGREPYIQVLQGIEGRNDLYREERRTHGGLFRGSPSPFVGPKPRAAEKILSVREADVLITIGGLNDTYVAGIGAIASNKSVLPFASFGGASLHLWNALHVLAPKRIDDDFRRLADATWNDALIDAAFRHGGLEHTRVFLGSSGKADALAREIEKYVEGLGFDVLYWKEFESGRVILDRIAAASFSCKYAILLLTPDDRVAGVEPRWNPRGNVLLELGYFLNALGEGRTMVIAQGGVTVPADYSGYIHLQLPPNGDITAIRDGIRARLSADLEPHAAPTGRPEPAAG